MSLAATRRESLKAGVFSGVWVLERLRLLHYTLTVCGPVRRFNHTLATQHNLTTILPSTNGLAA